MVDNIIREYLATGKRLTVPDLGTFLVQGEGKVIFTEMLKKDDGVLSSMLQRNYSLPAEDCDAIIANFAAEVRHGAARAEGFTIDHLGKFTLDVNSLLQFSCAVAPVEPVVASTVKQSVAQSAAANQPAARFDTQPQPVPQSIPQSAPKPIQQPIQQPAPQPVQQPAPRPVPRPQHVAAPAQRPLAQPSRPTSSAPRPESQPRTVSSARPGSAVDPTIFDSKYSAADDATRTSRDGQSNKKPLLNIRRRTARRWDTTMILAVVALVMAVGLLIYGMFANRGQKVNVQEQIETVQIAPEAEQASSQQ